jgi:GAF domain-containing protein
VLRIRERRELLQEVCRVATDTGGYDRAVVSLVDRGGHTASPVMRSGRGVDFPEPAVLVIGDGTEPDASLTSRALRTGQIVVCSDLSKTEPPVAKRDQVVALGYRILVALPLIVEGTKIGCLTLVSRDPTFVGDDEMLLLQDIAATLSFALRLQRQADAFEFLASYDPLTGLAKRALFCSRLDAVLGRYATLQDSPLVIAIDVHHLSDINDSYGRHFGDLVLQRVAERLRHAIDNDEHVGYLGGGIRVDTAAAVDLGTEHQCVSRGECVWRAVRGRWPRYSAGLPHDPASVTLVRSIIGLASAFGLQTVAEGVETREQLDLLRHLQCKYWQGFLHSKPLSAAQIEGLLSK